MSSVAQLCHTTQLHSHLSIIATVLSGIEATDFYRVTVTPYSLSGHEPVAQSHCPSWKLLSRAELLAEVSDHAELVSAHRVKVQLVPSPANSLAKTATQRAETLTISVVFACTHCCCRACPLHHPENCLIPPPLPQVSWSPQRSEWRVAAVWSERLGE